MGLTDIGRKVSGIQAQEDGSSSYGQILRATSIVGGGRVLTILVGLVRTKALAVLLGPAGVGVMGLLQGVMTTGTTLFGLGLGQSGVRQLAAAAGDPGKLSTVRKALWRSNLALGFIGLCAVWLLRETISQLVFGDASRATDVAWMGVGVLLSLIAGSQTALLQGLRRIGDMVKAGLVGAFLGTTLGVGLVWLMGAEGIRWFVLATPAASVLGAGWYARKLPGADHGSAPPQSFWEQWREMASLGSYLMVGGVAGSLTALAVRAILTRELGVEAAGHFQAAYAISGQYLGLVLGAMAADYYPRLTRLIENPGACTNAVNDQLEVALLLIAPILLVVLTLAPWVLTLLFSKEFQVASGVLRWQVLGDVLKVPSWCLGFLLLAAGNGKLFLVTELTTHAVFVLALYLLLPMFGLEAAGLAFSAQYVYHLPLVWWIACRRYGFCMRRKGRLHLGGLFAAAVLVTLISRWSEVLAVSAGLLLIIASAVYLGKSLPPSGVPVPVKRLSMLAASQIKRWKGG